MPFVKSLVFKRCARVVVLILLLGEIMPFYSYYAEKKLVYITICCGTVLYSRDYCGLCRQGFKTVISPLQLSLLLYSKSSILG